MKILKRFIAIITMPFIFILSPFLGIIVLPFQWILTGNDNVDWAMEFPEKYWKYMVK